MSPVGSTMGAASPTPSLHWHRKLEWPSTHKWIKPRYHVVPSGSQGLASSGI